MRIRLGRLVLRSYRSYVMWLPSGYSDPFVVYMVEKINEQDGSSYQLGAFTTEGEAAGCITRLESEGWRDLYINSVPVHERLTDWHWERGNGGAP